MSSILRFFCFLLVLLVAGARADSSWLAPDCRQFLLVLAPDWNASKGTLQRWEQQAGQWRPVGSAIPVGLGRNGLAWGVGERSDKGEPRKREGDGRAPAGIFRITELWTRAGIETPPNGFVAQRIHPDTQGVDDPNSRYYNRIVRRSQVENPDWDSYEKMDIPDYDRVLVVAHNLARREPGRGSCIFIHRWESSDIPTSGCTVMSEDHLKSLLAWLRPAANPRLVQLTQTEYRRWVDSGRLPRPAGR